MVKWSLAKQLLANAATAQHVHAAIEQPRRVVLYRRATLVMFTGIGGQD